MTTPTAAAITPAHTGDSVSVNIAGDADANPAGDADVVARYRAESRRAAAPVRAV